MYCWNCGEKLDDNAKFCGKCGANQVEPQQTDSFEEMDSDKTIILPEAAEISPEAAEISSETVEMSPQKAGGRLREKGTMGLTVAAGAAVAAAVVAVIFFVQGGVKENRLEEYMDIGYSFMEDGNYEEAAAAFESALGVDPKSKEAQEMLEKAYRGAEPSEIEVASAEGGPDDTQNIMGYTENPDDNATSGGTNSSNGGNVPQGSNASVNENQDNTQDPSKGGTKGDNSGGTTGNGGIKGEEESVEPVETTPDPEPSKEELQVVSLPVEEEENVKDLIQTFSVSTASLLEDWYDDSTDSGDYFEYEVIENGQPYALAALSLVQTQGDDIYDTDDEYVYNGISMCSFRDLTEEELDEAGEETYVCMDDDTRAAYLSCISDLFGDEYSLEDFDEYDYGGDLGVVIRQDDEGQFYLKVLDDFAETSQVNVEIEQVVSAEDNSEAAGTYGVLAKLTDTKDPENTYHIRCWVDPDDTSSYGYTIKKMIPAGEGEDPDPEFVLDEPEEETEAVEEDIFVEEEEKVAEPEPLPEESVGDDTDMTEEIEEQPDEEVSEEQPDEETEEKEAEESEENTGDSEGEAEDISSNDISGGTQSKK